MLSACQFATACRCACVEWGMQLPFCLIPAPRPTCTTDVPSCYRLLLTHQREHPSPASTQVDVRVFVDMPEANQTTEGSVPNYAGLMTWLHDHMSKGGKSAG